MARVREGQKGNLGWAGQDGRAARWAGPGRAPCILSVSRDNRAFGSN